jgi:hypothetical protein
MPVEAELSVDFGCEIHNLLTPWCVQGFWDFSRCQIHPDRIYVLGRKQFQDHKDLVRELVMQGQRIVFSNPFEGSETLRMQIERLGMTDLFHAGKILLISGGDMSPEWPYLLHDHFLGKIHDFKENCEAAVRCDEIYHKVDKPFSFLFLNGRGRAHRKWMIERLDHDGVLTNSLYSWLDPSSGARRGLDLIVDGENLMARPRDLHFLPAEYEVPRYRDRLDVASDTVFAKYELFNLEWGEIYIQPDQYIDTYFSVVTETVHAWPHSFRTEKIWKPMAMAHPWVCVANQGFYRDLRNMGFRTFHGIIDESFDHTDDDQQRLCQVADVIGDICRSGPAEFLAACKDICKYNQQHMLHLRQPVLDRFAVDFFQFLHRHQWMT